MKSNSIFRTAQHTLFIILCLLTLAGTAFAGTITGTVTNGSSSSVARVYLKVFSAVGDEMPCGTTIAAPGAFTINNNLPDGNYQVLAMMDVADTGLPLTSMPRGMSATFTITSGIATGADVTLVDAGTIDPQNLVPQPPQVQVAAPGDGLALVLWDNPRDADSFIQADSYNLYWKLGSVPGTTSGSYDGVITGIKPSDNSFAVVSGLSNDQTYYFVMTSQIGSNTSTTTSPVNAFIGIGSSGYTVSGNLTINNAPGPLSSSTPAYTVLVNFAAGAIFVNQTPDPATSTAFNLDGVSDGSYDFYILLDMNNNGYLDAGDLSTMNGPVTRVTVNGGNVTGLTPVVDNTNSYQRVETTHGKAGGGEYYGLNLNVEPGYRRVAGVQVSGGALPFPIDVGIDDSGFFDLWQDSPSRPGIGDSYSFDITYSDGTTETLTGQVTGVLDDFPTPLAPQGTVSNASTPTFHWAAPQAAMVAPFGYEIYLRGNGFSWDAWDIPGNQLSYDYDGGSPIPEDPPSPYSWSVRLTDGNGNSIQNEVIFTPISGGGTYTISGGVEDAGGILAGVTVTEVGNPGNTTTTDAGGHFSLPIAQGKLFSLQFTKTGSYEGLQTRFMTANSSFDTGTWYLFNFLDLPPGTGMIRASVQDSDTGTALSGATVTALSSLSPGTSYTVEYWNGTDWTGSATDSSGKFRVQNIPAGDTVILQGSLIGYSFTEKYYPVELQSVTEGVLKGVSQAAAISGTITNNSSTSTGRVFLFVVDANMESTIYGTSLDGPAGPFSIRNLLPDGSYQVMAFLEGSDLGAPTSSMPRGMSAPFTVTGGNAGNINITLVDADTVDAQAYTPISPTLSAVEPGDGYALVAWKPERDMNGLIKADSYNIYWKAGGVPTPTVHDGALTGLPANGETFAVIPGLANGTAYTFVMTATIGATESTPGVDLTVTPAVPSGPSTVSGSVTLDSNITANLTGTPLYVFLLDIQTEIAYSTRIADASAGTAFSIAGVPDGTYYALTFLDVNNNGYPDTGDINNFGAFDPTVTVTGDFTGLSLTLSDVGAFSSLGTHHGTDGSSDGYGLIFALHTGNKIPVRMSVVAGLSQPIDLAPEDHYGYDAFFPMTTRPVVGTPYSYSVDFADGTGGIYGGQVTQVFDNFPNPTAPVGDTPNATQPVFTWTAPSFTPTGTYVYEISLWDDNGYRWDSPELPAGTTSYAFADSGQVLTEGTLYHWQITAIDQAQNETAYIADFTPVAATVPLAVTYPNGGEFLAVGTSVNITWQPQTGAASYLLRYSTDGGTTWKWLRNNVTGSSFSWVVPDETSSQVLVRINAKDGAGNYIGNDFSDAPLSIIHAPQIISPNGGEILTVGSNVTINWHPHPDAASYLLRFSTDNGSTWQWLRSNVTGTSFVWTVPNIPSDQVLLRINAKNAAGNFIGNDFSDATFRIVTPPQILSPNGGETLAVGSNV
ncbi:hypothetical protein C2E25_16995, partial [Geothermobacter hydrogeniphilus]